ncbi:MAG: phenylalanine 4-monooxygenase [Flavobacteriales bacterium]|nr:phenylalanine 4-monooxygenase [Flavobacteriales bacterium]
MMNESKEYALIDGLQQEYEQYTSEDHNTWGTLFQRQSELLSDKVFGEYLSSLEQLQEVLNSSALPDYKHLNKQLDSATGWQIHVVPGLIAVDDFFDLLSRRRFSASAWIRKPEQLDYIEDPDMFHDVFGHIPLLVNQEYADFMQRFGEVGASLAHDQEKVLWLQRLYWFTIEFGLIGDLENPQLYGAGILSSYGETQHVMNQTSEIKPFDLMEVFHHAFRNDQIQDTYYVLKDFGQLKSAFEDWAKDL